MPDTRPARAPRSLYDEGCIAAHALDLLGDRWALLVIRELMLGAKRFSLIRAGLPGISASVLTQRLEGLEAGGVLHRVQMPEPAGVQVYELTPRGYAVWPVIEALCRWGATLPGHDPSKHISPSALMLSMRAMAAPQNAPCAVIHAGFDLGRESFRGTLVAGSWHVERGPAEGDILFAGTANLIAAVVYGKRPLDHWLAQDAPRFQGDPALGQRFVDHFHLRRA
ncbi:winged helix-turn-helix transcriptional regulator [Phaeovulum sp. W22_SRMD_FR3]|uniref:winged helix-turn-helix transcriptional regulator n=1 Tax=Phaeovulum sp. W22_SRMD_FR3 TaxID=3240274 RepID=UPI003F986C96